MRKLTRIANVILTVNNSCVKYNLNEDDLGNGLRTILGSLEEFVPPITVITKL